MFVEYHKLFGLDWSVIHKLVKDINGNETDRAVLLDDEIGEIWVSHN